MATDALCRFLLWVRKHRGTWDRIHVSGIALSIDGTGGTWIAPWLLVILSDQPAEEPSGFPIARTRNVMSFQVTAPISALPRLTRAIRQGVLPAGVIPPVDCDIVVQCPAGTAPVCDWSDERSLTSNWRKNERVEWFRWEAFFRGADLRELFPGHRAPDRFLTLADRHFAALGRGTVSEVGSELQLRDSPPRLTGSDGTGVRMVAPLPVRLIDVAQDERREEVWATVEVGPCVDRGTVHVGLYTGTAGTFFPPAPVPPGPRVTRMCVARHVPPCEAKIRLSIEGEGVIHEHSLTVKPPLKVWPSTAAVDVVEWASPLLVEGLSSRDSGVFERSIAHLLALVGYRSLWWGPNVNQKKIRFPVPQDALDIVAVNDAETVVLGVECTIDEPADKKLRYLVDRTKLIKKRLVSVLGDQAPTTRSLLVLARPRDQVPDSLLELVMQDRAGIFTIDDAHELIDMTRRGLPRSEISERFEQSFLDSREVYPL